MKRVVCGLSNGSTFAREKYVRLGSLGIGHEAEANSVKDDEGRIARVRRKNEEGKWRLAVHVGETSFSSPNLIYFSYSSALLCTDFGSSGQPSQASVLLGQVFQPLYLNSPRGVLASKLLPLHLSLSLSLSLSLYLFGDFAARARSAKYLPGCTFRVHEGIANFFFFFYLTTKKIQRQVSNPRNNIAAKVSLAENYNWLEI